jgi:hypothetical protein
MAEITYLMDADPGGATNAFFGNAKGYFLANQSVVVDAPAGGQTLEEVFDDLRKRAATGAAGIFEVINLVAHATGFSSLMFGLTKAERGHILTSGRLTNALATAASTAPILKRLGAPAVTQKTRVRLFGCDVGKDAAFLRNFGLMFGEPADVAAPLRVAVFRHAGASFTHRLARTWAVPWPSDIASTQPASWPAVRTSFTTKAESKFGPVAEERSPNDLFARDGVKATITTAANMATAAAGATFFFHEYFELPIPPGEPNPQAFVNTVKPESSATVAAAEISDLTVASRVGPADFTDKANAALWFAHVAVLAEVIDQPVSLTDSGQYRTVAIVPTPKPSPGPKAVGDAGILPPPVPPPADSVWQQVSAAFLLAGGAQGDLDALVADLDGPAPDHDLSEPELPVLTDADAPEALVEEVDA